MLLVSTFEIYDQTKLSTTLDFDGALYHVTSSRDKPFTVSIKLKFFRDLEQHGTDEVCSIILFFLLIVVGFLGSSSRIW
jgi:hypothetical protein